jgi:salicylate hydroxylase
MLIGREVTVLGAGIAGLAVARALALRGASVTVLEQAEAIREVGAGVQVSPNGGRVIAALGLEEAFRAVSLRSEAAQLLDGVTGGQVALLPMGGAEYRLAHRAALIEVLATGARAAGVKIRLLQRVEEIDLTQERPVLTLATGARLETDLVIGADGLHSKLRAALNGGPQVPFFTNQICWRAIIPADTGAPARAQVFMGAGKHIVSYPLAAGLRNIVAVEERNRWVEESYALKDDSMTLRAAFEDFCPQVQGWLDQVDAPWLWGLFRHEVAENWGRAMPSGAAVILGDAAHPTLPFLAQGASMGLEDAWVLADLFAQFDDAEAIARYQSTRRPRCTRIVAAANSNARNYHLTGISRAIGHLGLRAISRFAPQKLVQRYDWVYTHDVTAD